jgi:hypothetical protein
MSLALSAVPLLNGAKMKGTTRSTCDHDTGVGMSQTRISSTLSGKVVYSDSAHFQFSYWSTVIKLDRLF